MSDVSANIDDLRAYVSGARGLDQALYDAARRLQQTLLLETANLPTGGLPQAAQDVRVFVQGSCIPLTDYVSVVAAAFERAAYSAESELGRRNWDGISGVVSVSEASFAGAFQALATSLPAADAQVVQDLARQESIREGKDYADAVNAGGQKGTEAFDTVKANSADPYFLAGFYNELSPAGWRHLIDPVVSSRPDREGDLSLVLSTTTVAAMDTGLLSNTVIQNLITSTPVGETYTPSTGPAPPGPAPPKVWTWGSSLLTTIAADPQASRASLVAMSLLPGDQQQMLQTMFTNDRDAAMALISSWVVNAPTASDSLNVYKIAVNAITQVVVPGNDVSASTPYLQTLSGALGAGAAARTDLPPPGTDMVTWANDVAATQIAPAVDAARSWMATQQGRMDQYTGMVRGMELGFAIAVAPLFIPAEGVTVGGVAVSNAALNVAYGSVTNVAAGFVSTYVLAPTHDMTDDQQRVKMQTVKMTELTMVCKMIAAGRLVPPPSGSDPVGEVMKNPGAYSVGTYTLKDIFIGLGDSDPFDLGSG